MTRNRTMRQITGAFVRVIGGVAAVIFSPMDTFHHTVSAWTVSIGSSVPTRRNFRLVPLSRTNPMMFSRRQEHTTTTALLSSKTESETTSKSATTSSSTSLRELYPPWNSNLSDCCHYENGTLSVENGFHTLYYQVYSSKNTTTSDDAVALFLHGGPGAGCFPNHVRFFNPRRYAKVILLDQRGCGQSYAQESTKLHHFNTLQHLVDDIETLRQHLQIHQWTTILGGSWGSTLALGYAQEYPHRVYSLILRGICTMRQSEIDWLFGTGGGASQLFPESFQQFQETVAVDNTSSTNSPNDVKADPTSNALKGYHRAFFMEISNTANVNDTNGTEPNTTKALQSWRRWESLMSVAHKLLPAMSTQPALNLSDQSAVMKTLLEWDTNHVESPVVVGTTTTSTTNRSDKSTWTFQDANGKIAPSCATSTQGAEETAQKLRRHIGRTNKPSIDQLVESSVPQLAETLIVRSNLQISPQVLLTCQYSQNRDYCMNGIDILNSQRMQYLERVQCIAIQGGADMICPPDTALDLWNAWPTQGHLELRIPLHAGHSMYDPFLTNEVIRATDRIAEQWEQKTGGIVFMTE